MIQDQLANDNTDHAQAVEILKTLWTAQNLIEKQQWQEQVEEDDREQAEQQALREAEAKKVEDELAREKEESWREERKKNLAKFAPIPNQGVPSKPFIILAPSVLIKMEQGLWVPLWYYTNPSLANRATFDSMKDNELTLITGPGGIMTVAQSTNSRDSKGMVDDQNLTFKQFELVAMCMLTAMCQCG